MSALFPSDMFHGRVAVEMPCRDNVVVGYDLGDEFDEATVVVCELKDGQRVIHEALVGEDAVTYLKQHHPDELLKSVAGAVRRCRPMPRSLNAPSPLTRGWFDAFVAGCESFPDKDHDK